MNTRGGATSRPGPGAVIISLYYALLPVAGAGGAMALAPLQAAAGLFGAPLKNIMPKSRAAMLFLICLGVFVAYTAASALWSVYPDHQQAWKLVGGVVCGLLFVAGSGATAANRSLLRNVGAISVAVLRFCCWSKPSPTCR